MVCLRDYESAVYAVECDVGCGYYAEVGLYVLYDYAVDCSGCLRVESASKLRSASSYVSCGCYGCEAVPWAAADDEYVSLV